MSIKLKASGTQVGMGIKRKIETCKFKLYRIAGFNCEKLKKSHEVAYCGIKFRSILYTVINCQVRNCETVCHRAVSPPWSINMLHNPAW